LKTPIPTLEWVDPPLANPAIDAFLARACAKPPAERFPSMDDFIAALERLPVDAQRWPAPKPPARDAVSTHAQTRAVPVEGLSDTAIRPPAEAQLERKHEVPTDPWRAPVKKAHAPDESPTDPARKSTSRPDAPAAPPVVHEVLELPTDPERPAVSRRAATVPSKVGVIRQTVMGVAPAPQRRPWLSWLMGLIIAAVGLGLAFWLTRR
jgi:hypothetical protein